MTKQRNSQVKKLKSSLERKKRNRDWKIFRERKLLNSIPNINSQFKHKELIKLKPLREIRKQTKMTNYQLKVSQNKNLRKLTK